MYGVQPLMPVFSAVFGVTPAAASLTLSLTTGTLAFAMLLASAAADRVGRKALMVVALLASAALGGATALAPGFGMLLVLRGLMGLTLAGLPAVAMAYVAEEIAPASAGLAMGLFIGGNAIGGMSGRLITGVLTEWASWRLALAVLGATGLVCAAALGVLLPPPRHFAKRPFRADRLLLAFTAHLQNRNMRLLLAESFLLMGGFVTIYNYTSYRLLGAPYRLGQDQIGLIFSVYLLGVVSSPVMGNLALRAGRRRVLLLNLLCMLAGVALTLTRPLPAIIAGIALFTAGFFGAHSTASGWIGASVRDARSQASALYLFAYYAGSSVVGTAGGFAWTRLGWFGIAGLVTATVAAALAAAWGLPPGRSSVAQSA